MPSMGLQVVLLVALYGFLGALLIFLWKDERRAARGAPARPPGPPVPSPRADPARLGRRGRLEGGRPVFAVRLRTAAAATPRRAPRWGACRRRPWMSGPAFAAWAGRG